MSVTRLFLALILLMGAGCGSRSSGGGAPAEGTNAARKLSVAATVFPIADWLSHIGGEHVDVYCLVSGANNPHHFDPTTQDAVRVSTSRAVFAVGLELDPWAAKLVKSAGSSVELIETGKWITPRTFSFESCCAAAGHAGHSDAEGHAHSHEAGADPHFWHDPRRVIIVVEKLSAELSRLDPPHAADYKANSEKYIARLKELDAEVASAATRVPKNTRLRTATSSSGSAFHSPR